MARELDVAPKTVRAVLRSRPRPARPARPSALDPFRPLIRELVLHKELSGVRVLEDIRAVGYLGGYSILKEYIRSFRPRASERPHLRFETGPGVQGQVDLSPYTVILGEVPTAVVCFSMVLGFSRWQFIRFVRHADVHSVCHSHVLAFELAGGVPHEILYDRMKQVVLESYKDGVLYHPLFERLAQHYGFRAVPLAPGYKEGKGKVEAPFRYVEDNCLAGRSFHDLEDLNRQARRWLEETAWVRIHRTTRAEPAVRLDQERSALIALPPERFDAAIVLPRVIGDDFCVPWDSSRYSVPPRLHGQTALVRVLEGRIEIVVAGNTVAAHDLGSSRHQRYIAREHEQEFLDSCTSRHVLQQQFLRLGSAAKDFAAGLVETRGGAAGYHMAQILKLSERVGVARVAEAMRHAARYGAF
ncbi:MAG: IS21 family transposase, partial [Burkholderiales bacterium]